MSRHEHFAQLAVDGAIISHRSPLEQATRASQPFSWSSARSTEPLRPLAHRWAVIHSLCRPGGYGLEAPRGELSAEQTQSQVQ